MKKTIYDMKFILSISFVIIACAILLSFIYEDIYTSAGINLPSATVDKSFIK